MLHNIKDISPNNTVVVYKRNKIQPITIEVFTASFIYCVIKTEINNINISINIDTDFIPKKTELQKIDYLVIISPTKTRLNKERRLLQHFNVKIWSLNQNKLTNIVYLLTSILNLHAKKINTTYQNVNDIHKKNNLHYVNITGYISTDIYDCVNNTKINENND